MLENVPEYHLPHESLLTWMFIILWIIVIVGVYRLMRGKWW